MTKTKIIGIGHKARQGKDTLAEFLSKELQKSKIPVYIIHWADALKEEITNKSRILPLIERGVDNQKTIFYKLLNQDGKRIWYDVKYPYEIPELHQLMQERHITHYMGMDDKDSPMLQIWGTNYRRMYCDNNYWITKTFQNIKTFLNQHDDRESVILIPDTRFKNEVMAIKEKGGKYFKITRLLEDGTVFIDPSRDPNHASEIDLDEQASDYGASFRDGDLAGIEAQAAVLAEYIKNGTF